MCYFSFEDSVCVQDQVFWNYQLVVVNNQHEDKKYSNLTIGGTQRIKTYLNAGTGNACILHKISKFCPTVRKMSFFLSSLEMEGAFAPTGSGEKIYGYILPT